MASSTARELFAYRGRRYCESVEEYADELREITVLAFPEMSFKALHRRLNKTFVKGLGSPLGERMQHGWEVWDFPVLIAYASAVERVSPPEKWEFTHLRYKAEQERGEYAAAISPVCTTAFDTLDEC